MFQKIIYKTNNMIWKTKLNFLCKYLTKTECFINYKAVNKRVLKNGYPYHKTINGLTILTIKN